MLCFYIKIPKSVLSSYVNFLIHFVLSKIRLNSTGTDLNSKQCHILFRQNSTYIFMQEKHASKWSFNSEYQCTVSIAGLGIRINFLLFRVQLFFSIRIQLHTTNTLWRVCSDLNFNKFTIINNFNAFSVFLFFIFFLLDPHPGEKLNSDPDPQPRTVPVVFILHLKLCSPPT